MQDLSHLGEGTRKIMENNINICTIMITNICQN